MFAKKNILSASLFFLFTVNSYAGFGLETTRLVYNEKNKSEGVVAFNTDKNRNYLLQSWIEDANGNVSPDFVTTPPLLKLRAEQKNTLQVTKVTGMPADRETLYWLNVKFVAPSSEDQENVLRYSMTNKIKVIYRPDSLPGKNLDPAAEKLVWKAGGRTVTVKNPTPYYINISGIRINQRDVPFTQGYFAPFSDTAVALPSPAVRNAPVSVMYINDYGKSIEKQFLLQ